MKASAVLILVIKCNGVLSVSGDSIVWDYPIEQTENATSFLSRHT